MMNSKMTSVSRPADPVKWEIGTSSILFWTLTAEDLKDCLQNGIKNIELCLFGKWMSNVEMDLEAYCRELAARIKDIGIRVWSVHLPFGSTWDISTPDNILREEAIRKNAEMLQLGKLFEPVCAIIHPSTEPIEPDRREEHMNMCRASLGILARQANDAGIQLAVECLPRTCLGNNITEMKRLLEGNPLLGVCCDTNHLLEVTTEEFIRGIGDRIVTIHASDYDRIDERHWLPGRGVNNWNEVIASLAQVGYKGPFMFEVSRKNSESPITPSDLKNCWDRLLKNYLEEVQTPG